MVGVGGGGCEEYGFSVTNCDREVTIKPNKTKRIEISFRPDFTLSRVSNTLRVHTTGTELLFPLVATLPQHLLPHCYVAQPRPDWEKTLAWFSIYFWTLTLVVVVGVVLAQTNCGIKPKLAHRTDKNLPLVQSTGGKMFDFKDLAKSFQNTITRKLSDLKTKSMQPVETIKPTTTPAMPPMRQERKEREQETPPTSTITATSVPPSSSLRPSSSSTGHAQSNGRSQRQNPQTPSATVTNTAVSSNVSSCPSSELSNQNLSNRYSTPPSELRLRPPSTSHTTSHSPGSSNTAKVSSLRQNISPSPLLDESTKTSSAPSLSSSREKEKASTAAMSKRSPAGVVTETDKMTGTCTIVSQKPPADDQAPPTSGTDRKTEKPDKIVVKKVEPIPSASVESTALLGTPPNSRKVKPTRRAGGKVQRSPQPPEPKITPSPAIAPPAVVNNQGQAHVVPSHKSEGFVRKESESSIKSTDSESTSSSEKLDEREDSGTQEVANEPSKPKEVPQSLAKEPNTGQTVPITPVSDSPDVKSIALDVVQKKEKDESAGGGRGKGKKRASRQLLKREEKLKKKDRERERRERNVKENVKQERVGNSEELRKEHQQQQPGSGESSSSNSTEQLYEEQNDQRGDSQEADDEKSDVSSIPEKETSNKRDSKMAERESPKPGSSPLPQSGTPQKADRLAKKIEEDNLENRSSPVASVHAVPSTAFKTGRGKSSVIRQKSEEHGEPDRRSTKKSSSSRKSSDRTSKTGHQDDKAKQSHHVHVEAPPTVVVKPEQREEEEMEEDTSQPQILPVVDIEASEEPILSPDLSSLETDGAQHRLGVVAKSAQVVPTSPHELAAHLLAKNSAIKRRSKQRGEKGQSAEEGQEEGDYEDDEFEEASDGDTHPSGGVSGVYQQPPTAKHPRMDHSPLKSQGPPPPPFRHHHGDPPPPMAHRHMMIKPTTLSLDAEPFYPSSFQSKSSRQGRPRMVDPQAQDYPGHDGSGGATMPSPHVGAPPGFSPEDAMYLQHGPYPEKHYKPEHPSRSRPPPPPPPAHRKPSPPSPTYPSTVGDGHFPYGDHPGMEPQEHMPGFHTPPTRPDMLYDSADEPGYPPMGGRQFPDQHRDLPVMDVHHVPKGGSRRVTPTGAGPYPEQYMASLHHHQQRQQMMGGAPPYRSSRGERPPTGFTVTGQRSLWENPNAYRLQPLPGGEDPTLIRHQEYLRQRSILLKLYQQEQAALEAAIAREQAKRSAQTLSSLNQPYRSRSSMMGGGGKMSLSSPVSDAVWEGGAAGPSSLHDPLPSSQGFDDPGLNESIVRQRQLQQYLASHPPLRSRTFSGDSDIGGEFVSNPVQVPSSIGHPGLNRAPGPGSSEGRGQRSSLDHTSSSASSSGWPSRSGSEGSKFSKLWSPEASTTIGDLHDDHSTNSSLPFASNTYDLFENQSIWSMSNSDSSNLLSWAQYRSDSQQQQDEVPPDE